jgi:hypothetical protein
LGHLIATQFQQNIEAALPLSHGSRGSQRRKRIAEEEEEDHRGRGSKKKKKKRITTSGIVLNAKQGF